jgi:20S proteasome alpha/beta subunit
MGSNFLIGLRTDNFVILAADTNSYLYGALKVSLGMDGVDQLMTAYFSIINFNLVDHYKDYELGKHLYMVCSGELGDVDSFATWAKANIDLYKRRNGMLYAFLILNKSH